MRSIERCLGVMLARGGSKRIPGKNVRDFCGRPLIWWTLESARRSGCFSEIIVNTDDDAIASISAELGATIYRRPEELAGDVIRMDDVFAEMGATLFGGKSPFDCVVSLEATSPVRHPQVIPEGLAEWSRWDDGMVAAVVPIQNYWWGMRVDGDSMSAITPEMWVGGISRPTVYILSGLFYAFTMDLMDVPSELGWWDRIRPIRPYFQADEEIVDLDEEEDWERGEEAMRASGLIEWFVGGGDA